MGSFIINALITLFAALATAQSSLPSSANSCAPSACQDATTTVTTCVTQTAGINVSGLVTLTVTSLASTGVTVTVNPSSTVTAISTYTDYYSATFTTYVSSPSTAGARRNRKRQYTFGAYSAYNTRAATTTTSKAPATNSVQANAACSCAGQATATATSTSTVFQSAVPSTTTFYLAGLVTYTQTVTLPASTASFAPRTTSITSTTTVTLAAPTFTEVFGPTAGCIDNAVGPAQQLDSSITNVNIATQTCQDSCAQIPSCEFVYVQQLMTDWQGATPYYMCSFNDHHLNATADLECEQRVGTWGEACGFDAYGRGTVAS